MHCARSKRWIGELEWGGSGKGRLEEENTEDGLESLLPDAHILVEKRSTQTTVL